MEKNFDLAIRHDTAVHRRRISSSSIANHQFLPQLSHFDHLTGRAKVVDVGSKPDTSRMAQASGRIYIPEVAYRLITSHESGPSLDSSVLVKKTQMKGDVLAVAQLAGIMACKRTSELIPLCHPLPLSHIEVVLTPELHATTIGEPGTHKYSVMCRATASCYGKTGVEMEALTAVSVALLTVWDMLKAVAGKEMMISEISVEKKSGGRSGDFQKISGDTAV
jgi:GTP 3',8-cyclase